MKTNPVKIDDCEACALTHVTVMYTDHGGMWLCASCFSSHTNAVNASSKKILAETKAIDSAIQLKQDLFNAPTVSIIELRAAIEQNDDIPADQKDKTLIEMCAARYHHLSPIIFAKEQELDALRHERQAYQVTIQNLVSKLHVSERETYKQFSLNYQPVVKSIKPKKVTATNNVNKKLQKQELIDAAKKYDIPMSTIQSIVVSNGVSVEAAAIRLAKMMGKL